jgi:hypothetical protein
MHFLAVGSLVTGGAKPQFCRLVDFGIVEVNDRNGQ